MRRLALALAPCALLALAPRALPAQTRADSAAVLADAAHALAARGERDAALAVWRLITERFGGTAAADTAQAVLARRDLARPGSGRIQLVAFSTVYGAWLGIAVPAMFSSDDPTAYGLGLLVGGPTGFLLSNWWARRTRLTSGQADATSFGFLFGSFQGLGWQQALDLGNETVCVPGSPGFCYEEERETAPFAMMVAGGLAGMTGGWLLGRRLDPSLGQSAFAGHGAFWGTWVALAFGAGADDGDNVVRAMMLGGDVGLLAGIVAAPERVTVQRVWLTSALGVAGVGAGFGLALLTDVDDWEDAMRMAGAGALAGLAGGWVLTRDLDDRSGPAAPPPPPSDAALLDLRGGARLNLPRPEPIRLLAGRNAVGPIRRPALFVPLLRAAF